MRDMCSLLWCALVGLFRSRASLEAEILLLRHQLNILQRKSPKRMAFTDVDRLVFARLYHLAPGVLNALKIVKPETVIRWHRAGFRAYWRRRSGPRRGRRQTPAWALPLNSPHRYKYKNAARRETCLEASRDYRKPQITHR